MKWKAKARQSIGIGASQRVSTSLSGLVKSPISMLHGKPIVAWTHTRDHCEVIDDSGRKGLVASITLHVGEYIFPRAYLHTALRFVGETKDARMTVHGWAIYLDALLRDKTGNPVLVDGDVVDVSGWYLESALRDANVGKEPIALGATGPTHRDLHESTVRRIERWPDNKPPARWDSKTAAQGA